MQTKNYFMFKKTILAITALMPVTLSAQTFDFDLSKATCV